MPIKPGQEGGIFYRVPAPISTPTEDIISPTPTEDQPHAQEYPGDQCPTAGGLNPVGREIAGGQGRHRKGEGDDHADKTQVQHGRVDNHAEVTQQGVQSLGGFGQPGGCGATAPAGINTASTTSVALVSHQRVKGFSKNSTKPMKKASTAIV